MAFKLVYTSAPKGLKEGSFGFCTVACSRNLSERTIAALEAFSGYRRLFVDAERAAENPVAYSHVLLDDGETTQRVLSRIADAGLDYSNRNNKIASHLILEHTELRDAGPAAFFATPELFDKHWEGSPQIFEQPFVLPNLTSTVRSCEEWKKIAGDSGWAGVLAATVYTDRPVVLIARPEHNVLALYQEALSLLSSTLRWQATFSTYYTKTPPGIRCQWKATMQGSREAQTTRAIPDVLVLDLTSRTPLSPETVDSSSQAIKLINAARGIAISYDNSSSNAQSRVIVRSNVNSRRLGNSNDDVANRDVLQQDEKLLKNKTSEPLRTSTMKLIDYGRKLPTPLQKFLEKDDREQKRWRFIGVALVGVGALLALIAIGINAVNVVDKNVSSPQTNVSPNEKTSATFTTPDVVSSELDSSDKISASSADNVSDNENNHQEELKELFDYQEEKSNDDPFTFDEENVQKDVNKSPTSKDSSDVLISASNEDKQKNDGGVNLSDLFRTSSLNSVRRPKFLTQEEYQTTLDFQELVDDRELTVDFGAFQRGITKNDWTLVEEIEGQSQEIVASALNLCKKFKGSLTVTCDLSADQNNERQWLSSKQRRYKQKFDFSDAQPSNSINIFFKTADKNNEPNGTFSIETDSQGKLIFRMSDEATRNYFLRSCKLKWELDVPDSKGVEKDFIVETKYEQLLKPCEFDLLKDPKIVASIIELSNNGLLPLVVPSSLSSYDPIRNPKHSPALLVLLKQGTTPSAFNVDSQMDDRKKSVVFIFKLKGESVDAFKIRFTRNSQVVRCENVFDQEELNAQLDDFFRRQPYPAFPYESSFASPQEKLQKASYEIESALARQITFEFYLVSTTGLEQRDPNKYVFLGKTNITPKELDQKEK